MKNNKILIITALSLEFNEVKQFLKNNEKVIHPTGIIYNNGTYESNNNIFEVLLVETGPGNIRAADETSRSIEFFKPNYVFFVGIAGGIKDVSIGDVVASTKVIGFETGKADSVFKPRFDSIPASYILEQTARHVHRENIWVKKIDSNLSATPHSFVQPIAAGEKVVSSNKSEVFGYLKNYCSDAVAIDMEGIGFLVASRSHNVHSIEVRGISDLIENKAEADASGSQPKAAKNAAAFTFAMIDQLFESTSHTKDRSTIQFQNDLVNILTKLYDQGPEQDNIWKRAGGNVSILSNSSSRKSQWYDAIDKLVKGGGGKQITMESLINQVNGDYPNSDFIKKLFN